MNSRHEACAASTFISSAVSQALSSVSYIRACIVSTFIQKCQNFKMDALKYLIFKEVIKLNEVTQVELI